MFKVKFNLKYPQEQTRSNGGKVSDSPIIMIVRWRGNTLKYSTGLTINPNDWVFDSEQKPQKRNSAISNRLSTLKGHVSRIDEDLSKPLKDQLTPHKLRVLIDSSDNKPIKTTAIKTVSEFIDSFIETSLTFVDADTGKLRAPNTIKKYRTTQKVFKEFEKKQRSVYRFEDVNLALYNQFRAYLTIDKNYSLNTVGKHIATLKTFLSAARKSGHKVIELKDFKKPHEETQKIYVTRNELQELYDLDLSETPHLIAVRDIFYIGAWTALRYGDLISLSEKNIIGDRVYKDTAKVGAPVVIALTEKTKGILSKYIYNGGFPRMTNQYFNRAIKEVFSKIPSFHEKTMISKTKGGKRVEEFVERYKCVSAHTSRRSFCSNLYLSGAPITSIRKATSHKTEAAFKSYIRLNSDEHADILKGYL